MNIWATAWPIAVAIITFGLIIFIHEFGHFLFAKLFKIKVNEFAIGFGPAILKFQKGETKYALRILPFGGYCAMEGEDESSEDERAFCNAKVYKRIIVVAAGAIFNIILGFIIMFTVVGLQSDLASTTIAKFSDTAISNQQDGLRVDDKIVKINGRRIYTPDDITYMLAGAKDGEADIQVQRGGEKVMLDDVKLMTADAEGLEVAIVDFYVYPEKNNFLTTIKQGSLRTISVARFVWMSLGDLISGRYGLQHISGPVGIAKVMSEAAQGVVIDGVGGLITLLMILCMITVNLGVFNLLPIPALDGSRILFLIIEGIRKKPVKHEGIVHAVGMAILMAFMVLLVFKDLWVWIF